MPEFAYTVVTTAFVAIWLILADIVPKSLCAAGMISSIIVVTAIYVMTHEEK